MRHLGEALDKVRKAEYALLSHPQNLKLLLAANTRLHAAYLLKESFGQLWDYSSEAWARKFFDNWRAPLKWQRLAPYERFADMIERHRDGLAACCRPILLKNSVSTQGRKISGDMARLDHEVPTAYRLTAIDLHESSRFASTKTCDQSPLAMPGCQKSARGGKPGFSTK